MPRISSVKMNARQFQMLGEDPPGVRLELVDGEIAVSPNLTPKHSFAVASLARILGNHIEKHELGELYSDVDTLLDEYNIRRPDLLYYSSKNLDRIGEKLMEGPPDLAIEIISPGSVTIDRKDKFAQYRKAGVQFYWIVDPQPRTIEGWELKNKKYVPTGRGQGAAIVRLMPFDDLEISLTRLWLRVSKS